MGVIEMKGFLIGHADDQVAKTGCTVLLCPEGAIAGVDVRGGAPGTRETALLDPRMTVECVHGVLLSGGSAFGLDAASGVMQYLEEQGIGFDTGVAKVPIVPAAVLFDLAVGQAAIRPTAKMGYHACVNAEDGIPLRGNIGAGTGATVGKEKGMHLAMKSGFGFSIFERDDFFVAAGIAVNSFGEIFSETGERIAGVQISENQTPDQKPFLGSNTTIGFILTNAIVTKSQANKLASVGHNGYARSIRPCHTPYDGDTLFCLSTAKIPFDFYSLCKVTEQVVASAVIDAVEQAESIPGFPAARGKG